MSTPTALLKHDFHAYSAAAPQTPQVAPAPIVKWVGGKGRLLSQLRPLLPPAVDRMRHVEPFAGGAAMFFDRRPSRALLCDVNQDLIATYLAVRDELPSVITELQRLARDHSRERYYDVRSRYNTAELTRSQRAAAFIYLNKTCFNGLHRVNRRGHFNVPVGRYEKPKILNASLLQAASAQLSEADLRCTSFEALVALARPGDFVYLDPPYEPVSRTANFTSYAQDGFSQEDQQRLRDVYRELDRRGCKLMLSNSDVPFVRELYRDFRIDLVAAPRAINCNTSRRGKVSEVVVRNY
ncbi:MAG: DNA adenine methylase [Myxococcales bacterium]|nr:DNA adenine methylase [Myxococcales bacterium]MDD9965951.1 DNA adenine methylase [Myxococcales bacterium]